MVSGSPRWPNLARHFPAGRAFVRDKTGLNSERRDPHHHLHRSMTTGQPIPLRLFEMSDTNSLDERIRSRQFATNPTVSLCTGNFIRSAMPIRHYLQSHRFDAETARLLGVAFEMALVALQHADGVIAPTRDAVAQKIIELAKAGERDPERLCDVALKATQPMAPVIISDPS